ncbi:hypothetical protein ABT317_03635 [Streptomyces carpinensis]|uniref:Uncharacterized protein n=1 Tax=Streptomyces carpinensis TaxID=66369 RepID=A0ABV1VW53_9ACTN
MADQALQLWAAPPTLQLRAPADDPGVIPFPAQRIQRDDVLGVLGGLIHGYHNVA